MTDLDPQSPEEWEALRRAGYGLVDHVIRMHQELRESACWRAMPDSTREWLKRPAPLLGRGVEAALADAQTLLAPHGPGNLHPRFWGWVKGAGTVPGIFGGWLATAMNANAWGGDQAATWLELQLIRWFRAWFGFPERASGLLLEGASAGNLLALAIARGRATRGRVKRDGLRAEPPLRVYCSDAVHNSLLKAAELLGLGHAAVSVSAADAEGRADVAAMRCAIERDLQAGCVPCCIVASAGTVSTGAIDPLPELRALADAYGLWLHVDAAIGAPAVLSESLRPRFAGMERADSLAFDLHKWAQVPYDAGCLLVRDPELHEATFAMQADYLSALSGGLTPRGAPMFNALGPQLSRADRALKIWLTFEALGVQRIATVFERNVRQAQLLAALIARSERFVVVAPVHLNIVCFRLRAEGLTPEQADARNEALLVGLQESGVAVMSPNRVHGRFCLRAAICNHRTRDADLELALRELERLAVSLETEGADAG